MALGFLVLVLRPFLAGLVGLVQDAVDDVEELTALGSLAVERFAEALDVVQGAL